MTVPLTHTDAAAHRKLLAEAVNSASGSSTVVAGSVPATGTPVLGNSGYTCYKVSAGRYYITHNIGHTLYYPIPSCSRGAGGQSIIDILTLQSNYFEVLITDHAGTATDAAFKFILTID